jgi:hypothetical protein
LPHQAVTVSYILRAAVKSGINYLLKFYLI